MSKAVNAFGLWSGMLGESKMDTMVEKVAKAICKRRNTKQCAAACLSHSSLIENCPSVLLVWGEDAKAAIQAMHEPTEEMVEAAFGKHNIKPNPFRTAWYNMIDAALKE